MNMNEFEVHTLGRKSIEESSSQLKSICDCVTLPGRHEGKPPSPQQPWHTAQASQFLEGGVVKHSGHGADHVLHIFTVLAQRHLHAKIYLKTWAPSSGAHLC